MFVRNLVAVDIAVMLENTVIWNVEFLTYLNKILWILWKWPFCFVDG